MTVEKCIRNALLPFGDPVQIEPFEPESENKYPERYYTIRISTAGANNADNMPQHERYFVIVHFICPLGWDSVERVAITKKALSDAGTTWPRKNDLSDAELQHIVFECQIAQGADA